jgi:hypothetical protein
VTILVDAAIWRRHDDDRARFAHLASDTTHRELHDFARRLGIPAERFQGDHYDVTTTVRKRAIELGAVAVPSRELVRRLRAAGLRRGKAQLQAPRASTV